MITDADTLRANADARRAAGADAGPHPALYCEWGLCPNFAKYHYAIGSFCAVHTVALARRVLAYARQQRAEEALVLPDDLAQVPLTPHVGAMSEDAPARPTRQSTVTIRLGGVEVSATAESREAALRQLLRAARSQERSA